MKPSPASGMTNEQTPPAETTWNDEVAEARAAPPPTAKGGCSPATPAPNTGKSLEEIYDWLIEDGHAKPAPLGEGEWIEDRLHWHKGRGYYYFIVLPGRRHVSCRTNSQIDANRFKECFENGRPTIRLGDIKLGKLLRHAPPGVKPVSAHDLTQILPFWGPKTIKDVTSVNTKAFYQWRRSAPAGTRAPSVQAVRGELVELMKCVRAAGRMLDPTFAIVVWMPPKSPRRERWLRRNEVARFLWALRGRVWDANTHAWRIDPLTGKRFLRDAAVVAKRRYLARLVVLGLYTGSRLDTMLEACWTQEAASANTRAEADRAKRVRPGAPPARSAPTYPFGHIDLVDGLFYRQGFGRTSKVKRKPPVKLVPLLRILARGWHRRDTAATDPAKRSSRVIHRGDGGKWFDAAITDLWRSVVADAGLDDEVIRHTLRHTAATWLLEGGASIKETADFLGVSERELLNTYAHVDPAFTVDVAAAMDRAVAADTRSREERIRTAKAATAQPVGGTGRPRRRGALATFAGNDR